MAVLPPKLTFWGRIKAMFVHSKGINPIAIVAFLIMLGLIYLVVDRTLDAFQKNSIIRQHNLEKEAWRVTEETRKKRHQMQLDTLNKAHDKTQHDLAVATGIVNKLNGLLKNERAKNSAFAKCLDVPDPRGMSVTEHSGN